MSKEILSMQILYARKTERCHPVYSFPLDFEIWHTHNHWANGNTTVCYINIIVVPYVNSVRERMELPADYWSVWFIQGSQREWGWRLTERKSPFSSAHSQQLHWVQVQQEWAGNQHRRSQSSSSTFSNVGARSKMAGVCLRLLQVHQDSYSEWFQRSWNLRSSWRMERTTDRIQIE